MRKINLKTYEVDVVERNLESGAIRTVKKPYELKESIINSLFNSDLRLGAVDLIKQNTLAKKILAAKNEILLEDAEYEKLKNAIETVKGYSRNDVEMVQRILEAPIVEVTPKPKKK